MPARLEARVTVCGVAFANVTVSPALTVADVGVGPVGVSETLTLAAAATAAAAEAGVTVAAMMVRLVLRCISIPGCWRRTASHRRMRGAMQEVTRSYPTR